MGISEKVAYLKGLADGLKLDKKSDEQKLMLAIIEVLDEVADAIDNIEFDLDVMGDELDDVDSIVDYHLNEESCGHGHGHGHGHDHGDGDDYDGEIYEVTCPSCEEGVLLDEDMLDDGEVICPKCGELLEIDFSGSIEE